jgi:NADPH:quinone reductase-like Zn-dependent oxidoreductase
MTHSDQPQPNTAPTAPALPSMMNAVVQRGYGGSEVLHVDSVAVPRPGPREALIEVRAAGLDRGTWHLMTGTPYAVRLALGLRTPRRPIAGLDLAGVVIAVGSEVTRVRVGDEVFGIGKGSFADYCVALESKLAIKPANLTFEQAAAVPVSGLTALSAVLDKAAVSPGDHVLITGASGGVGTYAVQLTKAEGAHVTAVCSGAKADLVTSLGADAVIDYASEDFTLRAERFDVVIDIGGNTPVSALRRCLKPAGRLTIVGGEGSSNWSTGINRQIAAVVRNPFVREDLTMVVAKESGTELERLVPYLDDGRITPAVDQGFPLNRARDAMDRLVAGQVAGKVVLIPGAQARSEGA